jgi:WD40 repeat protein
MPVRILHFSPDGRFLAVKYHKEEIQFYVWDLNRRAALVKLANGVHRNALDFSPDSKWVAAGQIDGTIRRFDLGSGEEAKPLALGVPGHTLRFHPGGRKLAISGERSRSVLIADLDSGKVVRTLAGHAGGLHGLAWHPDGRLLAVGCDDYHVHLWDADRGTKRAVLKGHQAEAVHVTFNNHGDLLASQSWDGTTRLWDPWTGQALVSCTGWGLRFAPGDDRLAFSLGNHGAGTWEVATGRECRVLRGHPGQEKMPWEAAFSTDGQLLASVGGDGVRFWDGVLGKEIAHLRMAGVTSALFHPDGKSLLLSGTFGLQRRPIERDPAAGECIRIGEPQSIWKGSLGRASISTDGRILAALQAPAQLIVLDLEKQVQLALWERHPSANTLAISPDGRWVACGMWRGSGVKVWEARTGKLVRDLPVTGHHSRVDFSPDGRWLVTITYQDYGLWRVGTWEPGPVQERAAVRDLAGSAAFSRDGKVLAVSYEPGRVQMIDPVTGQKLALLEAPTGANLIWLAFSPDGTRLAAASAESHLIQLWDLRQVRKALTALRLDWDLSPIPPLEGEPARPLKVEIVELNGP